MASIRKRGDTWSFRLSLNDMRTGKRMQPERGGFKSKRAAEQAAKLLEAEIIGGTFVNEDDILFKDFFEIWIKNYMSDGLKEPGTERNRRTSIKRVMTYYAYMKIKSITKAKYQSVLEDLRDRGFAKNSIAGTHAALSIMFSYAVEMEIIKKDPSVKAIIPEKKKTIEDLQKEEIPRYLEKTELNLLLECVSNKSINPQDYAMFHILAYTGMRIGELFALHLTDLDLENRTISINKNLSTPGFDGKPYRLGPPKTKRSKRKIDIDDMTVEVIRTHIAWRNKTKMKYRNTFLDSGFLFVSEAIPDGRPPVMRAFNIRMQKYLKRCELPKLSPHSLRHTHASLYAEAEIPLEVTQERLGHSDDKTTKLIYLHITKKLKRASADKFSEFMRS